MDDYRNETSSIRGFNSAALELNDHKCAICYPELPEPVGTGVLRTGAHRFCMDCIVRYDF